MTKYDSIDSDFGTEQTERATEKALQELARERAARTGRLEHKSAGAVRKPVDPDRPF